MPDFERITDSLMVHVAGNDPVKRARAEGYIKGKNRARYEILAVAVLVLFTAIASIAIAVTVLYTNA
jgi:hypothetical protein